MSNNYYENNYYSNEIGKMKLLSKEEEIELAKRMEMGDETAREEFIERNLRLVPKVAAKYNNLGLDFDDLVSAGNFGVIKAVDSFDYRKNNKFSTLAVCCITREIIDFIEENGRTIRINGHRLNDLKKICEEIKKYVLKTGEEPDADFLAKALNINKSKIMNLLDLNKPMICFDEKINDDEETYMDYIVDKGPENRDEIKYEKLRLLAKDKAKNLSQTERFIVENKLDLNGDGAKSIAELSRITGITQYNIDKISYNFVESVKKTEEFQKLGICA